jgi:hypothetical protein
MPDMTLYFTSPGTGDLARQRYLTLTTESPVSPLSPPVPDYGGDGEPGLTLKDETGLGQEESEQSFRWDASQAVQFRGTVNVVLHAKRRISDGPFMLDVRLRICGGTDCTEIKYQQVSSDQLGEDYVTLNPEFGSIDIELAAGEALELLIGAPPEGRQVWLAYDTAFTPSQLTSRQT